MFNEIAVAKVWSKHGDGMESIELMGKHVLLEFVD